jgi:hypothetical protein
MALRTRTVAASAKFPGGDAEIEQYLDSKGVEWEFLGEVTPRSFDQKKSLRNQARFRPLEDSRVEEYAEAMRRGDTFPPVLAYGKPDALVVADGNHRLDAALKANVTLKVYRLTADASTLMAIMYERNAKHGLLTTEEERVHQALTLLDNGADIKSAAAMLSLPRRVLERASAQRSADQRFRDAGIAPLTVEKLPEGIKRRLANVHTDEGLVAMTELAVAANLNTGEVYDAVTALNELRSGALQAEWVAAHRASYAERIQAAAGGVFTRKPQGPKQRTGMALSTVLNVDREELIRAYVGPEREQAAEKMRQAARKLNALAKELTA